MKQTRIERLAQEAMELSERLLPIIQELNAIVSNHDLIEKQRHMRGIEKSIDTLKSAGVPIPEELAERSCILQEQLHDYETAAEALRTVRKHLSGFIATLPSASPRNLRKLGRCSIADLFSAGLLQDGMEIIHKNKHSEGFFTAVLRKPGNIEIEINGHVERFDTPSGAGQRVAKRSVDGWLYWYVRTKDGAEIVLNEYRQQFLRQKQDE